MTKPALLVLRLSETIFEKVISPGRLGSKDIAMSSFDLTTNFSSKRGRPSSPSGLVGGSEAHKVSITLSASSKANSRFISRRSQR
jgi:hypothetical protein